MKNHFLGFFTNTLWFIGLGICIYLGIKLGVQFKEKAIVEENLSISQPKNNKLYLSVKNDSYFDYRNDRYDSFVTIKDLNFIVMNDKKINYGYVTLNIIPSETDSFELLQINTARGENKKDAIGKAKNIRYKINQHDSLLTLDHVYEISKGDKWRAQDARLILKVPRNKMIYLDKSMKNVIYDIKNASNTADDEMLNRTWIMGTNELRCIDCKGLDANEDKEDDSSVIEQSGIHVNSKNATIKIDRNGIDVRDSNASVKISTSGINIKEKK